MPPRPFSHPLALERLADALEPVPKVFAAAVAIATHHEPQLKPQPLYDFVERMAADARHMLAHDSSPIGTLKHIMFHRHGFAGNHRSYSDPFNSYIDVVLARRRGLPILLSLIYAEVARRAGTTTHGIGLPGHFVVAVDDVAGTRHYVDVFNQGRELSADDCKQIALANSQFWGDAFLTPVTPQAWILRILNNLQNTYTQMGDTANAAAVVEQILVVDPANQTARRQLAEWYAQIDRLQARDN